MAPMAFCPQPSPARHPARQQSAPPPLPPLPGATTASMACTLPPSRRQRLSRLWCRDFLAICQSHHGRQCFPMPRPCCTALLRSSAQQHLSLLEGPAGLMLSALQATELLPLRVRLHRASAACIRMSQWPQRVPHMSAKLLRGPVLPLQRLPLHAAMLAEEDHVRACKRVASVSMTSALLLLQLFIRCLCLFIGRFDRQPMFLCKCQLVDCAALCSTCATIVLANRSPVHSTVFN